MAKNLNMDYFSLLLLTYHHLFLDVICFHFVTVSVLVRNLKSGLKAETYLKISKRNFHCMWKVCVIHRIIDDRIEKSIKRRRIGHCTFAASIFKVQRLCQYTSQSWEGGRTGTALAHPLTTPIPHARPGMGYICGLWGPPTPFVSISRLLRHSSLRQSYFEKKTM